MTLQQFDTKLKEACPGLVYELAAPKGKTRYVVWHRYGRSSTYGDDRNQLDMPKVQIDIISNDYYDLLAEDVAVALWTMDLPYEIISEGYDDDYAAYRTILQLVVV